MDIERNICFVNTSHSWGGGEKWHAIAAIYLSDKREVHAIVQPNSELERKLRPYSVTCKRFAISNRSFLNPLSLLRLYRFFKHNDIKVVVLNLPADLKAAGIAAKLAGVDKIIYRRGMPHPIRNTWLNRFLFQKVVSSVIVNSQEIGRSIVKRNPAMIDKERIHVLYNGVNCEDYRFSSSESDTVRLVTMGRCVEQKNQAMLLDVVKTLVDNGHRVHLYLAGTGPLESELRERVTKLHLDQHVTLMGFVEDTKQLLSNADIFVFPSHYEGSANAIVEALASGVPCIAFDTSSMPELVIHEQTGLLATYPETQCFTEQVERLINDSDLRQRLAEQARSFAEERLDNSTLQHEMQRLLK